MNESPHSFVVTSTTADMFAPAIADGGQWQFCIDCAQRRQCIVGTLPAATPLPVTRMTLSSRQALCHQGDAFSSVYTIRGGALKSLITSEDGRQQIVAIHLPNEVIGAEGIASGRRSRTVVAIEDSQICAIGFAGLERLMRTLPAARLWFQHTLGREMARGRETVNRLRCGSAEERIASFLLDLSRRLSVGKAHVAEFRLSASRGDIAFHLGLTRETVSRAFAKLRRLHLIDGDPTRIRLCDPVQLSALAAAMPGAVRSAAIDNCHATTATSDDHGDQPDRQRGRARTAGRNDGACTAKCRYRC
jgi:CRP/FNR family transcriptional regulator